jgi:hypothetical protein
MSEVVAAPNASSDRAGRAALTEEDRFSALVDLLAGLSPEERDLATLSDLLAEPSADVRVRSE